MEKKKFSPPAIILTAGLCLALTAGLISPVGKEKTGTPLSAAVAETKVDSDAESPAAKDAEANAEESGPVLTKEQKALYEILLDRMEENNLAEAAAILEANAKLLPELLEQTLDKKRYLYNENGLTDIIEGRGLVITSASTVFYGNFQKGKPEGNVVAMQEIVLEAPRYDYSVGTWENGKMNGAGTSGYLYYRQAGEADGIKTEKSGMFSADLMEGELRYTCINNLGDSSTWKMIARAGVTVIDERWDFKESENVYYLPSENNKSNAYSLSGEDVDTPLWKNRIIWDE